MFRFFNEKFAYWGLSALVFVHFVVLWLVRYSNEYVPGVLAILAFLWLVRVLFRTPLSMPEKALYIAMALVPISTLVRLLFDISYSPSAFDIQSRFIIVIPLMIMLVRFGVNRNLFAIGLIFGVVFACYFMVSLSLEGYYRPKVNMNQITSANFMAYLGFAVAAFLSVKVFIQGSSRWWFVLAAFALILALVAVVLSKTRGAWMSLPFFVFASLWLFKMYFAKWQLITLAMVAVIGGFFVVYAPGSPVLPRISTAVNEVVQYQETKEAKGSMGVRLNMWETSVAAFKENPLFGLGEKGLQKFEREGGVAKYLEKFGHQHSDFFDILAKRGLVGLAFFYGFWVVFFWVFHKFTSPGYREAGILLGVGYLVFGLTETTTGNYAAMSLLAVQTAFLFGAGHREWLLVNQPELLERFSTYWPDRPEGV